MGRKKKHPEHINHERWLISYADFITLLFAFFVVMFAVSQVDSKRMGRFTESFAKAVGIEAFTESGVGILPGGEMPKKATEPHDQRLVLAPELESLQVDITMMQKNHVLPAALQVFQRRNELVIRLSDRLFFAPGDDQLNEVSTKAMRRLALELKPRKVDIRIEGHTDNRPIHTSRFRSNWDLSTSRATAVVALLAQAEIEPERLSAAGYGEFHPVAPNTTELGRQQNRRVDLVVSLSTIREKTEEADKNAPPPPPVEVADSTEPTNAPSAEEPIDVKAVAERADPDKATPKPSDLDLPDLLPTAPDSKQAPDALDKPEPPTKKAADTKPEKHS